MKINNIFKVISIVNCLLLQSQLYATNDVKLHSTEEYGNTDAPNWETIKYIECNGNINLDQGLSANNNKLYPTLQIDGINMLFTEDSNINIGECNELLLNNCNIILNGKVTCLGNINLILNNTCLKLNNGDYSISLLEKYKSKITLKHSILEFKNLSDSTGAIELFSNPSSYPKIVLNDHSSMLFTNNVKVNLNKKGQIVLDEKSFLGCSNSTMNLGTGKLTATNSRCNFVENANLQVESAHMRCTEGELECTGSNIQFTNGTINIDDSEGKFTDSQIDLGSGTIDIANSCNDKISTFELDNSIMKSDSENFKFKISARNQLILTDSKIQCFGSFIKSNNTNSQSNSDPITITSNHSSFAFNKIACNQEDLQIDVQGDAPSFFGSVDLFLDNMKD